MTNKQLSQKNSSLGYKRQILNKFKKIYNSILSVFGKQLVISSNLFAHETVKINDTNENAFYSYEDYKLEYNIDINITNYHSDSSHLLFAFFLVLSLLKVIVFSFKTRSFKNKQNNFIQILIRCKFLKILFLTETNFFSDFKILF